jgi:hypothetical protein
VAQSISLVPVPVLDPVTNTVPVLGLTAAA